MYCKNEAPAKIVIFKLPNIFFLKEISQLGIAYSYLHLSYSAYLW